MMKNLQWQQEGQRYLLKNDASILLVLNILATASAEFMLNEKQYRIYQKGTWNPAYLVTENDREILRLTHNFWGRKGTILFNDGTTYSNELTSNGSIQLRFSNAGNEILTYRISLKNKRPSIDFVPGIDLIDAEKLLLLAALGMTVVSSIFNELNSEADATTFILLTSAVSSI